MAKITRCDHEMEEIVQAATLNARIAQIIYATRIDAGLTQQQLAELIGTQKSVISELENADYQGHSLSILQWIAHAHKLTVRD